MSDCPVSAISGVIRNVSDLQRSVAFYRKRLGFQCAGPVQRMVETVASLLGHSELPVYVQRMRLGGQSLYLVQAGATARRVQVGGSNDLTFQHFAMPCADIETAYQRLYLDDASTACARPISASPVQLPAASGGALAYKFRDPDGHPLEFIQLSTIDHAAQRLADTDASVDAFDALEAGHGIDHAAMSAHDAEVSLSFYMGVLGLTIKRRQLNIGAEQGELDDLIEPVVDVIGLDVATRSSPHLELLAYQSPRGLSPDRATQPADLVDIVLAEVRDRKGVMMKLIERNYPYQLSHDNSTLLLRDPDGHMFICRDAQLGSGFDAALFY